MTGPVATPVVEHVLATPVAPLLGHVGTYSGYREAGLAPATHRGLPSPSMTFIVTLDEPLVVAAHPDPAQRPSSHRTLLGGLHTSPALVVHQGSQAGLQVSLDPLAARAVLGLPAGELSGLDVDADDVLGPLARLLQERVAAAATWPERFAAVDEALLARADPTRQAAPEVRHAWRRLLRSGGRVRIADLVEETGWSARHLSARFAVEVGLTPKAAARVVRFDRARRRLQSRPQPLADLAAAAGYADQAHLAREFRALAGCPPSTWLAEEVTNVQADGVPAAAGSAA